MILTTLGSSILASLVNSFPIWIALGRTRGVASGAPVPLFWAWTPVLIRGPITIPIDSVNNSNVVESNFCWRILSMSFRLGSFIFKPRLVRII